MRIVLIVIGLCLLTAGRSAWAETTTPNFVYIMVDDMGPSDAGFLGSKAISTPNLDRLASQSLLFTEAYSGCTVCAPCRSVLLTGKHMGRTSVRLNTGGVPLLDEDVTVAEVLQRAGYCTGGFGKWGLGDIGTTGVPEKQGFDLFYGYYHQIHAHKHYPAFLVRNGVKEPVQGQRHTSQGYAPQLIFNQMTQFIRDAATSGQPFFCYAPWTPPHGNYDFPRDDPVWERYKNKNWKGHQKGHAAMVTLVDRYVGQTIELLSELDVLENTVIFFHSDNGAALSPKQCPDLKSSGPLRGHKRSAYEGGVRAPTLVFWKGRIEPGTNRTHIISAHDVLPTLAELAGATEHLPGGVTGISYAPVLFGRKPPRTHEYHYWEWTLWNWSKNVEVPGGMMQGLRQGDWKIARERTDQPWELYNLADDIGETKNLAARYPDKLRALATLAAEAHVPMRPQREPKHPAGQSFN